MLHLQSFSLLSSPRLSIPLLSSPPFSSPTLPSTIISTLFLARPCLLVASPAVRSQCLLVFVLYVVCLGLMVFAFACHFFVSPPVFVYCVLFVLSLWVVVLLFFVASLGPCTLWLWGSLLFSTFRGVKLVRTFRTRTLIFANVTESNV